MSVAKWLAVVAMPALVASCTTLAVQDTEQMLAASGFTIEPASSVDLYNEIQLLPPHQLMVQPSRDPSGAPQYLYADPTHCHCLYVGGPSQYTYYRQLVMQQRIAEEQLEEQEATMPALILFHGDFDHGRHFGHLRGFHRDHHVDHDHDHH